MDFTVPIKHELFPLVSLPLKRQSRLQQTTISNIFHCFSEKISLDVSSESSAWQRIHMKHQALFSSKDKSKKNKMSSAAFFSFSFFFFFWGGGAL